MEIAQIGIVIKHIGDFEEEDHGFQATSSKTCLRLCQWESEFKIGSPWVFGSESVGPISASSSPLATNGNSPRWKGTKNASEVNQRPKLGLKSGVFSNISDHKTDETT